MIDCDDTHDGAMRTVCLEGRWYISVYETPHVDHWGKSGIRVTIHDQELLVYDTGMTPADLVYVGAGQTIDGDRSILSAANLCAYDASHDRDDEPRDAGWDTEGLENAVAMAEEE